MEAYFKQKTELTGNDLIEISLGELEVRPIETLKWIYRQLELPDFEVAKPCFQRYLNSQRVYRKNNITLSGEEVRLVQQQWGEIISSLGYDRSLVLRQASQDTVLCVDEII